MELIKNIITKEPEKVNGGTFLELAKQEGKTTVSTGVHHVKLLRGETGSKNNYKTGKPEEGVWLFFDEEGIEKKYFAPMYVNDKNSEKFGKFHYLFEKFADIPEGSLLEMEYIKKGITGYIDVRAESQSVPVSPVNTDEIPIIEEEEVKTEEFPF